MTTLWRPDGSNVFDFCRRDKQGMRIGMNPVIVKETTSWMVYRGHSMSHSLHLSHRSQVFRLKMLIFNFLFFSGLYRGHHGHDRVLLDLGAGANRLSPRSWCRASGVCLGVLGLVSCFHWSGDRNRR